MLKKIVYLIGLVFLLALPVSSSAQVSLSTTTCPGAGCTNFSIGGGGSISIQITGTWVGTITFRSTVDNSTYTSFRVVSAADTTAAGITTTTANGVFQGTAAALNQIRVVFTAYTSGTAVVTAKVSTQAAKFNQPVGGSGGIGTVTSVGLSLPTDVFDISGSPVTTSGTLAATFDTQTANTVFSGPATGSPAAPTFRALVTADLPSSVITGSIADTQVAFGNGTAIAGDAGLRYNSALNILGIGSSSDITGAYTQALSIVQTVTPGAAAYLNTLNLTTTIDPSAAIEGYEGVDFVFDQIGTSDNLYLQGVFIGAYNGGSGTVSDQYGLAIWSTQMSTGNTTLNYGLFVEAGPHGTATGDVTSNYGVYSRNGTAAGITGIVTNHYSYYARDVMGTATNPYAFWYDGGSGSDCNSGGVYRVNHFGISAYYNPCFTKYTPALANFERIITRWGDTGVFGADNRAYLGVEVGGTGTARPVNLIGANYSITSTLTPAVSNTSANSCGTTAASIVGNDNAGKVTVGATSGTSCTVTFATAFTNAPSCTVTNETTANLSRATSTTTTAILAGVFVAGDTLAYVCIGR